MIVSGGRLVAHCLGLLLLLLNADMKILLLQYCIAECFIGQWKNKKSSKNNITHAFVGRQPMQ